MKTIEFNVNQYVMVKLTSRGRALLKERYDDLMSQYDEPLYEFKLPEENDAGWSRWQLWHLMASLGKHCFMGPVPPFETTIMMEIEDAKRQ